MDKLITSAGVGARCRLCNGPIELTGHVCRDKPEIKLAKCSSCGFVQLESVEHISIQTYGDAYFGDIQIQRDRERSWNENRLRILLENVPSLASESILDFGCGTGGFLEVARRAGLDATGFDLSARVVESHKSNGWPCVNSLEAVNWPISFMTLFHVLEHIKHPSQFLSELMARFPSMNGIAIEVPNEDEFLNAEVDIVQYKEIHYHSYHLQYFDQQTLRRAVVDAGLRCELVTQYQRYPLSNAIGWLRDKIGGGQDRYPMFNDRALNIAYAEMLRQHGRADSLIAICWRR